MRQLIIMFYVLTLATTGHSQEAKNGLIREDEQYGRYSLVEYKDGIRDGVLKRYEERGEILEYEVKYVHGKQEGPIIYYYFDGILKQQCNYENDILQGPCKEYHRNGQLRSEVNYVAGNREGPMKYYFANGNIEREINYVNNKEEGVYSWYYENGKLSSNCIYKEGKIDGLCNQYYEDGSVASEAIYDMGVQVSTGKVYYPNGKIKEEEYHENGKRVAVKSFHENGQLQSYLEFDENNVAVVWKEYFDDGSLRKEMKDGEFVSYNSGKKEDETAKYMETMVKSDPSNPASYLNRGSHYFGSGRIDKALLDLNKAIELYPMYAAAYEMRGMDMQKDNLDAAIKDFEKSIETMCCQPHQIANMMSAYMKNKDYDKAVDFIEQCRNPRLKTMVGVLEPVAYEKKGDIETALKKYHEIIETGRDPYKVDIYYIFRANAYYKMQNFDKCWDDVEKAKSLGFKNSEYFEGTYKEWLEPKFFEELTKRL